MKKINYNLVSQKMYSKSDLFFIFREKEVFHGNFKMPNSRKFRKPNTTIFIFNITQSVQK